jgi:hypothetical protein
MFGTMLRNYTPPSVSATAASLTDDFGFAIMSGDGGGGGGGGDGGDGGGERLVAKVGSYSLQAIPMTYDPPLGKPERVGNWSTVLNDYLGPRLTARQQKQVFMETSKFIVLYDGYPKSTVHLLLIPRPVFLVSGVAGTSSLRAL